MFCRNCGNQVSVNSKFCTLCGAPLDHVQPPAGNGYPPPNQAAANSRPVNSPYNTPHMDFTALEKSFKKYIAPNAARNMFIVFCILAIPSFLMLPVGIGLACLAALFAIMWAVGYSRINKRISAAQSDGTYQQMLREFSVSASMLDGRVRYSEHYIWGKNSGWFHAYQNIYWIYRYTLRYILIPVQSAIMIGNQNGKIVPLCKLKLNTKSGNKEIQAVASIVYNKNPNVLLGFDGARQAEYKRRTHR